MKELLLGLGITFIGGVLYVITKYNALFIPIMLAGLILIGLVILNEYLEEIDKDSKKD